MRKDSSQWIMLWLLADHRSHPAHHCQEESQPQKTEISPKDWDLPTSPSFCGKWDRLPLGANSFITQLQSCEGRTTPESVARPNALCPSDSKGKGLGRKDEEFTVVPHVKVTLLSPPSNPKPLGALLLTEFHSESSETEYCSQLHDAVHT